MRGALYVCVLCGLALLAAACGGKVKANGESASPCGDGGCGGECAPGEVRTGCPCSADAPAVSCFDGTADQAAHAPCAKGLRTCDAATSTWGACDGQVLPELEVCDLGDNDCDGEVDEGVTSACGVCDPGCDQNGVGDPGPFPFPADSLPRPDGVVEVASDGVGLDENGDLTLDAEAIEYHFLWVANAGEGTVSKIDTRTGYEVARYASVSHGALVDVMGVGGAGVPTWGGANSPSRTAVDFFGNVWVGNRAMGYQPSATKIWNNPADCADRNGNGVLDTSTDVDGSGTIDLSNPVEFLAEEDECIAMTVVVGTHDGLARALAIDSGIEPGDPGNVWVGMYTEQAFYQLSGTTGELLQRVPPSGPLGLSPYGAAIDSGGHLYAPNGCCGATSLTKIDTVTGTVLGTYPQSGLTCGGAYGIAIDLADRVWLGGWPCGGAFRFDPATTSWAFAEVVDPVTGTNYHTSGWGARGIGADALGNVWLAIHQTSFVNGAAVRINADTLATTGVWNVDGAVPVGAAVDFDGNVWTINQNSSDASRLFVDSTTGEPSASPDTGNMVDVYPVGASPYTYSDFTGLGLRTITRQSGEYRVVMEGCPFGESATWESLDFDATVPAGSSVEFWLRTGDTFEAMRANPAVGPWAASPADLTMPPGPISAGRYLELTVKLISEDRVTTPIVHAFGVQWTCPMAPVD